MRREVGLVLSNVSQPASFRRFRPLTRSSRCGYPAPEPIRLEALAPRCGSLPLPVRSFASEEDVSDVTHRREPWPAHSSGEGAACEPMAQTSSSCRSRGARARARSESLLAILTLVSGFAPRRAHWARRADRVPARSAEACLNTTSLVDRARRARSPPLLRLTTQLGALNVLR